LFVNPTTENPAKLFLNDFDDNGQLDKIFTRSINGKDKPVFMKAELEAQMPFLKKQNLRHNAYAQKSVQELMSAEKINSAIVKSVNTSSSCIAINKGNGQFEVTNFPPAVQFSSVKCITALDANGDGLTDLILGGNEFGFQPQLGRLDANTGLVLLNKGKQGWQVLSEYESGITGNAQMRDMVMMQNGLSMCLVLLYNNEVPAVYKFKKTASTKK
jgi:enediyne biosynthesis protein E4